MSEFGSTKLIAFQIRLENKLMRFFLLLLFIVNLTTLFSCSSISEKNMINSRLAVVQTGDMGHKPWSELASNASRKTFNQAIYEPLFKIDSNQEFTPGLASHMEIDSAKSKITFTINTSKRFCDSRSLRPEDVEFAIIKPFISNSPLANESSFSLIKGSDKLKKGQRYKSGMLEGVSVITPDKIEIQFQKLTHLSIAAFAYDLPPIGPVEIFSDDYYDTLTTPIGSGAYYVEYSSPNDSYVRLKRKDISLSNESSCRYPLVLDFYEHGLPIDNKVDLGLNAGANGTTDNPNYTRVVGPAAYSIQVIDFNINNKHGSNYQFRGQINNALNRDLIWTDYDHTFSTYSLIKDNSDAKSNDQKVTKNKINKENKDSSRLKIKAWYHGLPNEPLPLYIKIIKQQLFDSGIDVDFQGTVKLTFDKSDSEISFYTYGIPTSQQNQLYTFSLYMSNTVYKNHSLRNDSKFSSLYKKTLNAKSVDEYKSLLGNLSDYVSRRLYLIPIGERRTIFAYSNRVQSIGIEDLTHTFDFDKVEMKN